MSYYQNLKAQDEPVFNIIQEEYRRQAEGIELIASENYVSSAVMEAMSNILTNKYSEGYPKKRYYGGNEVVDKMETLAIDRAKQLFKAEHVNVQPLSGAPANIAVYMAFLNPGDKVMGLKLDHGGHLSHGHKINFSGKLYNFVQYEVGEDGYLDMEQVRELVLQEKPKMIVAGYSAYSREVDWKRFKEIADEVGAYTFADIAHTAGLIVGGCLNNPVELCDVVSTTTHKTLRGPRGAMIMCKEKFAKQIDRAVFPGVQGGPHEHIIAGKAVAFGEALQPEFKEYGQQVIANAQAMVEEFHNLGYEVVSGGTDNHLFVLDFSKLELNGRRAEEVLDKVGVSTSRSTIPNDPKPPMKPSGLRIGTPAITTRGMKETEAKQIVQLMDRAFQNEQNVSELENIKQEIKELTTKFKLPQ